MTDIHEIDAFTRAYIDCALWSSNDESDDAGGEPMDAHYSAPDLAPQTLAAMLADCVTFQKNTDAALIALVEDDFPNLEAMAGHDFWLTRNGHGAGFWDGDWPEPYASELDTAARAFGSFELYIGDDGLIYASGYERYPDMPA